VDDKGQLNILGGCSISLGPASSGQLIDLLSSPLLRPGEDIPLLVLLATASFRSRLDLIETLDPGYKAIVSVARDGRISDLTVEQLDALKLVDQALNRSTHRLREALAPLSARAVIAKKARSFKGTLALDPEICVDYDLVRWMLTGRATRSGVTGVARPKISGAPSQATALVRGPLAGKFLSHALAQVRSDFRTELALWLGESTAIQAKLPSPALRQKVAIELIDTGASSLYINHMMGLTPVRRTSGGGFAAVEPSVIDLAEYAVPSMSHGDHAGVAATTLTDLLKAWFGKDDAVYPIGQATVMAEMPSNWGGVAPMPLKIDIVVAEHEPATISVEGVEYRSLELERQRLDALREAAVASRFSYLALAVPLVDGRRDDFYNYAPRDRFKWWLIDAKQYFASYEHTVRPHEVLFPVQNSWNLSLCSILWAARWVQNFYQPLRTTHVVNSPLQAQIDEIFTATPNRKAILDKGWSSLEKDLPEARQYTESEEDFSSVSFALGLGTAMQLVCGQLTTPALGGQTQIRTYTPEALFGTVSMWLFSRVYHQFMELSLPGRLGKLEINQRLLPIWGEELAAASRLHRAALWHVITLYRCYGVDVRVVPEPAVNPSADRAWYGKNIGNFRWISLDANGWAWLVDQGKPDVQDDHHHFFLTHSERLSCIVNPDTSEASYSMTARLQHDNVALAPSAPAFLLPAESAFLEHPELWPRSPGRRTQLLRARDGLLQPT
jgi:hypothetical protein